MQRSVFLNSVNDEMIRQAIQSLRSNVTLVFAGADKLVDSGKTRSLVPLFPKGRIRSQEIAGAGHEIFNEVPQYRTQAIESFIQWIDSRGRCG
jgi:alpha-beta hydrolase superfamily lysophospholipase